jgi:hypothetical protein
MQNNKPSPHRLKGFFARTAVYEPFNLQRHSVSVKCYLRLRASEFKGGNSAIIWDLRFELLLLRKLASQSRFQPGSNLRQGLPFHKCYS